MILSGGSGVDAIAPMKLWDTYSGNLIREFIGHMSEVQTLVFSYNGKFILSGNENMILWDSSNGTMMRIFSCLKNNEVEKVNSVAFSPDDRIVINGSSDKTIKIWELLKIKQNLC